jgi:hypothetical protein
MFCTIGNIHIIKLYTSQVPAETRPYLFRLAGPDIAYFDFTEESTIFILNSTICMSVVVRASSSPVYIGCHRMWRNEGSRTLGLRLMVIKKSHSEV